MYDERLKPLDIFDYRDYIELKATKIRLVTEIDLPIYPCKNFANITGRAPILDQI